MTTRGHCLCGATRWEFDGPTVWACYCHCDDCRRNCAAPVVGWLGVPDGAFRWLGTAPATYPSSPGVTRSFCGACGTPLAFVAEHYPGDTHLYAASLADPATFKPEFHVFWSEKLPWLPMDDDLPKYPKSLAHAPPELRER